MRNLIQNTKAMWAVTLLLTVLIVIPNGGDAIAKTQNPKQLIVLIFDNSGAASLNADELKDLKKRVLWNLRKLPRHLRHANIKIVSVHSPRVLFSGTSRSIRRQADELVPLLDFEESGCADLVGVFQLASTLIDEAKPDNAVVISLGAMIHTGSPCSDAISLPQNRPAELSFEAFAAKEIRVLLFGIHHLQRQTYSIALRRAGLKNSKVLGIAESKALLKQRGGLSDAM